jgi:hypothetical protein
MQLVHSCIDSKVVSKIRLSVVPELIIYGMRVVASVLYPETHTIDKG